MSALLQQLNMEMGDVVNDAKHSLVQVRSGRQGSGAGAIWHPDGLIITNAHVVRNRAPQVILPDGSNLPARILAHDASRDMAALSVDASGLPTIELGDSRTLRPGQWVMALGHPWGVSGAATGGVVIGAGVEMPQFNQEWIAVSLHLQPGYSGGPLVDAEGRLVGINTMMMSLEVGMAVPVHVAKVFLKEELGAVANGK